MRSATAATAARGCWYTPSPLRRWQESCRRRGPAVRRSAGRPALAPAVEVLARLDHAVAADRVGQVRGAPAGGGHDQPVSTSPNRRAELRARWDSPLCACNAPQQPCRGSPARAPVRGSSADRGVEAAFEAAEHQRTRAPGRSGEQRGGSRRRSGAPTSPRRRWSAAARAAAGTARSIASPATAPAAVRTGHRRDRRVRRRGSRGRTTLPRAAWRRRRPSAPVSRARIRLIRPRGEDVSRPVMAYVGQAGRQKPQEMQRPSSSGSNHSSRGEFIGAEPSFAGLRMPAGSKAVLMRVSSAIWSAPSRWALDRAVSRSRRRVRR